MIAYLSRGHDRKKENFEKNVIIEGGGVKRDRGWKKKREWRIEVNLNEKRNNKKKNGNRR